MRTFMPMKQPKEKTKAQKTVEGLKDRPMPEDAKEAVRQKQTLLKKPDVTK